MPMRKVVYVGYSDRMLRYLINSELFELTKVVFAPQRVNEEYRQLLKNSGLDTYEVLSKSDISGLTEFINDDEVAVMYKFEYILPQKLVSSHRFINFHGGFLKTNRGAHATVRTILNMDNTTALSMYELTGGIDVGKLIAEYVVKLDMSETPKILNDKLQDGIPTLLEKLNQYLTGEIQPTLVENGKYYPKVQPEDFTINPLSDGFDKAYAIVRSQEGYGGALIKVNDEVLPVKEWSLVNSNEAQFIEDRQFVFEGSKQSLVIDY